ncbi:MAG: hypothetical protein ABIA04_12615 [Pseudomonadota bacterium]
MILNKKITIFQLYKVLFLLSILLFTIVFFLNAWVTDDAFISFRTVDNFVNGHGLTWNIIERAQAYSHPAWLFCISFLYLFTNEVFYTSIFFSYLLCLLTLFFLYYYFYKKEEYYKPSLLILLLISSKAFIDYSSSGLENPLSYLLATIFFTSFLKNGNLDKFKKYRNIFFYFFIASLAYFNRPDSILLYSVPCLYILFLNVKNINLKFIYTLILASLPITLWISFSIIYYGFPLANTNYAKVVNVSLLPLYKIQFGVDYFLNSIILDPLSHIISIAALFLVYMKRNKLFFITVLSVLFYYYFIIFEAAAASHFTGRFFSIPFLILFFIFVSLNNFKKSYIPISLIVMAYLFLLPYSTLKMGTKHFNIYEQNKRLIDLNYYAHQQGAAIFSENFSGKIKYNKFFISGTRLKNKKAKIHVGGSFGDELIGFFGYAAGPEKYIIDYVALSDPFLSQLPACNIKNYYEWLPGHFIRLIPKGYLESIKHDKNLIQDPQLKIFYDKILNISRGDIFSLSRFKDIFDINFGRDKDLLLNYSARTDMERNCKGEINTLIGKYE